MRYWRSTKTKAFERGLSNARPTNLTKQTVNRNKRNSNNGLESHIDIRRNNSQKY